YRGHGGDGIAQVAFNDVAGQRLELVFVLYHVEDAGSSQTATGLVGGDGKTYGGFNVQRHYAFGYGRVDHHFDGVGGEIHFGEAVKQGNGENAAPADHLKTFFASGPRNDAQLVTAYYAHVGYDLYRQGKDDQT